MSNLQDIDQAVRQIQAGQARPVYLVFGDQDYLVRQAYDRLCEALVPEDLRAFNFEQLDGAAVEVPALLASLNTLPMMPGPKALGVPDCRFLLSKASASGLMAQAREKWEQGDPNAALRQLAKVLVLAEAGWEDAAAWGLEDFRKALAGDLEEDKLSGDWLAKALAQGRESGFPLPRGGDDSQDLLAGLEKAFSGDQPPGHLVLAAASADGRKKLFKWIEKAGLVLDFKTAEKGPQAAQTAGVFLRNLLAQRGLAMDTATAQRVVSAWGQDLGLMARELDKMEAWAHPRKQLKASDLEAVGSPRVEEDVFGLLGSLGRKDLASALPQLRALLKTHPAPMLFAMLAKEVRLLFLCRCLVEEGLVPSRGMTEYPAYRAGLYPRLCRELPGPLAEFWKRTHAFVSFQGLSRCRRFSLEELKEAMEFLQSADLQMKSSGRDASSLMEELSLRLCGAREEVFL